jgi:hypothetical protein
MKGPGLIMVTLFTLLLTWLILPITGKGYSRSPRTRCSREAEMTKHDRNKGPLGSAAGLRYQQCQPNHWRACLLQH